MAKDLVYVFDKLTKTSSVLGEIQSGFNISFVIDGTKDSLSILVWSYSGVEIEPYSIILHKKTMSWWVVSHDKVERYQNDNGGFVYIHNLELLGAIELLNARDLTDCGFNDNDYRVSEFINRLFVLSNVDDYTINIVANTNFKNKIVNFIKTFENYTLLSALREFLDAYNMCPKLSFGYSYNSTTDTYTLTSMDINIISKTGDRTRVHQISEFDDVRETKTMDKNSFGTTVVSNAENVISSKNKTYPASGTTKLSSTEMHITSSNSIIRLPSKVFNGNWIKLIYPYSIGVGWSYGDQGLSPDDNTFGYYPYDYNSALKMKEHIINTIRNISITTPEKQNAIDFFEDTFNEWVDILNKAGTITLYDGNKLVPNFTNNSSTVSIEKGDNIPYLATIVENDSGVNPVDRKMVFCDKETRELLPLTRQGVCWERGSNIISGFEFIGHSNKVKSFAYTDLQIDVGKRLFQYPLNTNYPFIVIDVPYMPIISAIDTINYTKRLYFIVNYVPMGDIKIKVDNQRNKKDIQLYNQNGRLTDNVALSKLLNSYSKEISSDTITRYTHFYYTNGSSMSMLPNVGDIVMSGNDEYVINNLSMDITQTESNVENEFGYFVECEITMSKLVSTKSLMVNPNTNIRDYGIPQNYNVKRKQLYRDYYELTYQAYSDADNSPYLATQKVFNFAHTPNVFADFVAVMKLSYREEVEDSYYWYYQLETTNYYLDKMLCVMLDFQDNNIIGYGSQNVFSGFVISRIFQGLTDNINTPISYVDNHGWVLGISIKLLTNEQITYIYDAYQQSQVGGSSYDGCLYNYSVFIPSEIYEWLNPWNYDILIDEPSYYKDALEVPVFEYVCQIDDSEDVLIGDNILQQHDGFIYFYSYVFGDNLNQNNVSTSTRVLYDTDSQLYYIDYACEFSFDNVNNELSVSIWNNCIYYTQTNTWEFGTRNSYTNGKDYAIFRHAYNVNTGEEIIDLMFIAKKVPNSGTSNLVLKVNHYKLK